MKKLIEKCQSNPLAAAVVLALIFLGLRLVANALLQEIWNMAPFNSKPIEARDYWKALQLELSLGGFARSFLFFLMVPVGCKALRVHEGSSGLLRGIGGCIVVACAISGFQHLDYSDSFFLLSLAVVLASVEPRFSLRIAKGAALGLIASSFGVFQYASEANLFSLFVGGALVFAPWIALAALVGGPSAGFGAEGQRVAEPKVSVFFGS